MCNHYATQKGGSVLVIFQGRAICTVPVQSGPSLRSGMLTLPQFEARPERSRGKLKKFVLSLSESSHSAFKTWLAARA
jgi:hypothetical protein